MTTPIRDRLACNCGTKFCKHNKAQVWSCGGGVQSCAIAALIVQGKLPKPDFSVIADTGYETGATWEFMDRVLVPELAKVGVDLVRVKASEWSLSSGILHYPKKKDRKNEFLHNLPVFTAREFEKAKLKNYCTTKWKIEVVNRWLSNSKEVKRQTACQWIGFSSDEQTRYVRGMMSDEFKAGLYKYPLVHEVPMTRRDAIKLVESMGWGTPPRSACYMCPNHSDHEWRKLKAERPEEFQKAVELEREIHKVDPDAWLHRSCIPLDQVDFSQPEDLFSRPCDSGMCFV